MSPASPDAARPAGASATSDSGAAAPVAGSEAPEHDRPQGPVAAAVVAAATAILALGVFSVLNQWMNPTTYRPSFAVAGGRKMIFMWSNWAEMIGLLIPVLIVWLLAWAMLQDIWRERLDFGRRSLIYSLTVIAVGLVGSFPPFYTWLFPG